MNIDSIQNGIVLDHIAAGKALQIYNDLHLDKLDCSVAIIKKSGYRAGEFFRCFTAQITSRL